MTPNVILAALSLVFLPLGPKLGLAGPDIPLDDVEKNSCGVSRVREGGSHEGQAWEEVEVGPS